MRWPQGALRANADVCPATAESSVVAAALTTAADASGEPKSGAAWMADLFNGCARSNAGGHQRRGRCKAIDTPASAPPPPAHIASSGSAASSSSTTAQFVARASDQSSKGGSESRGRTIDDIRVPTCAVLTDSPPPSLCPSLLFAFPKLDQGFTFRQRAVHRLLSSLLGGPIKNPLPPAPSVVSREFWPRVASEWHAFAEPMPGQCGDALQIWEDFLHSVKLYLFFLCPFLSFFSLPRCIYIP